MIPLHYKSGRKPGRYRIGDRVRITRGFTGAEAVILEHHGILGPDKQHVYTVRVKMDGMDEFIIDYPEDEMEPWPDEGSGAKGADGKAKPGREE
jgi:hypothetical protein